MAIRLPGRGVQKQKKTQAEKKNRIGARIFAEMRLARCALINP